MKRIPAFHTGLLKRTFRLIRTHALRLLWGHSLLHLLQATLPLAFLYLLKWMIDTVTHTAERGESLDTDFLWLLAGTGMVFLLQDVAWTLGSFVHRQLSVRVQAIMYELLHRKALRLDLAHFEEASYYDKLSRAVREAPYRPALFLNHLLESFRGSLALLLMLLLLTGFHWSMAFVLMIINLPLVWVRLRYSQKLFRWNRDQTERERQVWYLNWLLTGERAAAENRLFGLGPYLQKLFRSRFDQLKEEEGKHLRRRTLAETAAQAFKALGITAAFGYIFFQTAAGAITVGSMVMYLFAFQRGLTYLRESMTGFAGLYEDSLFLKDVFDFTDLQESITSRGNSELPPLEEIRFERVTFTYPGKKEPALQDVSFTLSRGEVLALAGPNGAGKTTLVKLLCRLYDPAGGSIYYNGTDIRHYDLHTYRRAFAVVFQDFMLYRMSIRQNIRFGGMHREEHNGELWQAARDSGVQDVIERLPGKMETMIGSLFGESVNLSWGEWQKLALARALYRKAPLLVLDEPTSAMDALAEAELFDRFSEVHRGRSCLLISHRMANVKEADRIVVLENGRLQEEGSHEDLMARNGLYHKMYRRQSGRYETPSR